MPVNTIAMSCSSAAAMTSASRIEPPGWMTARMPAAAAGIKAVIQPGGSMRDKEVIAAADEHGLAMVFTGVRHFRH